MDAHGNMQQLTLRNVRCVPSFRDSLLSVNQLWASTSTECRFGSTLALLSPPCATGGRLLLPFGRSAGLYVWRVILRDSASPSNAARAMTIHASRSRHYVNVMSPRDATVCPHRRLHIGATRLRQLPKLTADAPASLASGRLDGCAACSEANAPELSHPGELYTPSYAGRLVHAEHCWAIH
eukprot:6212866-Pleurochrysis_carterae.AAC.2